MAPLKPVSRMTLSMQVATQIAGLISAGHWKPNEKLASEAELCKELHVGRSTVREALKMLSFAGIVRMRAGAGTYVSQGCKIYSGRGIPRPLPEAQKSVRDLFEARLLLECELAALCAERSSDEELRHLEDLVRETQVQVNAQASDERLLALDLDFHVGIAAASKNLVLVHLYQEVRILMAELLTKIQHFPGSHENMCAQHAEILKALKDRKPDKARRCMNKHLHFSEERVELHTRTSEPEPGSQRADVPAGHLR